MIFNISSILNEPFLIDEASVEHYKSLAYSMLTGEYVTPVADMAAERARLAPFCVANIGNSGTGNRNMSAQAMAKHNAESKSKSDYIGAIQVSGVVLKGDQACGPMGTKSMTRQVEAFKQDPNCIGLVGILDTPGGQASYTDLLADAVRGFGKPTAALVEGMAASAGYWLASSFDNIYTTSVLDKVGSIGAMITIVDTSKHLADKGIVVKTVYSDYSKDKNAISKQVLAGDDSELKNEFLNPMVRKFMDDVKMNRSEIAEETLTGKMYTTDKAMALGMVDGIKSFDEVVASIVEQNEILNNDNKDNNMNTSEKKYEAIASVVGFETAEIVMTDGHASLSEESLDAVEARLTAVSDLETANANLETASTELTEANTALQTQLDDLQAEFAAYKAKPGAGAAASKKGGDSFAKDGKIDIDAFAHNKAADDFLK